MALLFPCKKAGGIGLASLVITTPPTTTTFAQYDTLDLTGLKVTATFKDGLVADVTDLCQITPADGSELSDYGNIDITIKYANKTVTQSITVNQMTAIAVTTQPTKTRYKVGENLNLSGIVVTGTAGALSRNVTSQCIYNPPNETVLSQAGNYEISVSFYDAITSFVVNCFVRSLFKKMPSDFSFRSGDGAVVIFNNEIYVLADTSTDYVYKWNGGSWVQETTMQYNSNVRGALSISNIWVFYDSSSIRTWDGTSWGTFATIGAVDFTDPVTVLYNNQYNVLGGSYSGGRTKHYKWNGSAWVSASTLPYGFFYGSALEYNGNLHILGSGSSGNEKKHYKWNGSSWSSVSTLPYEFYYGCAVVYNNEIHILGGSGNELKHYKWNGSSWVSVSTLPFSVNGYSRAVVWNTGDKDEIILFGSRDDSQAVAQWDGTSWTVATE